MSEFKVGDKVRHKDYGHGVVVGVGEVGLELGCLLVKLRDVRYRHDPLTEVEMLVPVADVTLEAP